MKTIFTICFIVILLSTIVTAQCTDSDGGKNKYTFGTVTDQESSFQDTCEGENIKEYFCSVDGVASYTTLQCVNGCVDGECQLANEEPKNFAPEQDTENGNFKLYFYGIIIAITIGLYIYWFKIRNRKKSW